MRIISRLSSVMPDGRHSMLIKVDTEAGVYEIHFDEVVELDDAYAELPDGILTGIRPSLLTMKGGCYEIGFDLVANIDNGTPFKRPHISDAHGLATIIAQIIGDHYNVYRPYCYTFLAFDDLLARAYRIALMGITVRYPESIKDIHRNLDPNGRGYAIELN
jgi:hypothetical protein